jgi:hypothetical protein
MDSQQSIARRGVQSLANQTRGRWGMRPAWSRRRGCVREICRGMTLRGVTDRHRDAANIASGRIGQNSIIEDYCQNIMFWRLP